jgi:4-hydroxy-2-oxoheptanedioate aldolase
MINSARDAEAMVEACLYPPVGVRSYGPVRAAGYGGKEPYHEVVNDLVLILPQVETGQAIDNLDAILDVAGVSGVYVGPSDLGISLGMGPGLDRREDAMLILLEKVVAATRRRGKIAAVHAVSADYASFAVGMGFNLVTVVSDIGLIGRGSKDATAHVRAGQPASGNRPANAAAY